MRGSMVLMFAASAAATLRGAKQQQAETTITLTYPDGTTKVTKVGDPMPCHEFCGLGLAVPATEQSPVVIETIGTDMRPVQGTLSCRGPNGCTANVFVPKCSGLPSLDWLPAHGFCPGSCSTPYCHNQDPATLQWECHLPATSWSRHVAAGEDIVFDIPPQTGPFNAQLSNEVLFCKHVGQQLNYVCPPHVPPTPVQPGPAGNGGGVGVIGIPPPNPCDPVDCQCNGVSCADFWGNFFQ